MIDGAMVALGISPEGRPVPIQLTAAGLLAVSGGSGGAGNGAFVGGYTLIGIAPDGTRVPIAVDSNGVIQTSGGSGDATAQGANTVQAGPTTGAAALPTYRALVGADLPSVITKATSFTANGAASLPALSLTGIPFAGTGTTSFPLLYLNNSGATASTTLSTSGTVLGINSHGTPRLIEAMVDGATKFAVTGTGRIIFASGIGSITDGGGWDSYENASGTVLRTDGNGVILANNYPLRFSTGTSIVANVITPLGTASLQLGAAASATPVAYTLTVGESSRGGTDTNVAGASGTFASGRGTGTGAASSLIFQTPTVGSTGTTQQTLATRFTIATAGLTATVPYVLASYTVAGLPAAVQGGLAFVTDSVATAITGLGLAVTGGGSNKVPVYSDGTNWIVL